MGGRRVGGLKARVGRECCFGREGGQIDQVEQWRYTCLENPRRSYKVGWLGTPRRSRYATRRTAPGMKAA